MLWLGVLAACVGFLFHAGELGWSDGRSMYEVTKSIVEDGDVAINDGVVWRGAGGSYYSPYGIGLSLVAIVPYIVTKSVAPLTPAPEAARQAGVAALMPVIFALLSAGFYGLCRRLEIDVRTSVVLTLGTMGGTFVVAYSKFFCSEPLATLCIVVAIERAIARSPAASGMAAAMAALVRPQFFAFTPFLLWRIHADGGIGALARSSVPLVAGLFVATGYNVVRFNDPLNFGYSNSQFPQGFTTPFLEGATGLLLSPEKSILLFAPIVALIPFGLRCLWGRNRTAFWLLTGNLMLTFTMSATWWAWGGGWMWGPRLLIPGVIPAVAAVGLWRQGKSRFASVVMCALFVLGAAVNFPAMLVGAGAQLADQPPPQFGPNPLRQWSLAVSAVTSTSTLQAADLSLWQVKAVHRLDGRVGLLLSCAISCVLLAGAALSLYRIYGGLIDAAPVTRQRQ